MTLTRTSMEMQNTCERVVPMAMQASAGSRTGSLVPCYGGWSLLQGVEPTELWAWLAHTSRFVIIT